MSDFPSLQEISAFLDTVQVPDEQGQQGDGNNILFAAVVANSSANATGKVACYIDGSTVAVNLPVLHGHQFLSGETVWGIKDGSNKIILGSVGNKNLNGVVQMLATGMVSAATGGRCLGTWADGLGSGVQNIAVGTTQLDLSLGLTVVPVRPNRLLRLNWRLMLQDSIGGQVMINYVKLAWNSGGVFGTHSRRLMTGNSGPYPSETMHNETFIVTPSNAFNLSVKLFAATTGGTAYAYRYSAGNEDDKSHISLEDVGSAKSYNEQL